MLTAERRRSIVQTLSARARCMRQNSASSCRFRYGCALYRRPAERPDASGDRALRLEGGAGLTPSTLSSA